MATRYALNVEHVVSSTQDVAFARFTGTPLLVVSERQTAGRGRDGRVWEQPRRGLFASLAFKPWWPQVTWPRLTLVAGLAAREVFPGVDLKWPNDLLLAGRKAGGILTEVRGEVVVVGFGANLWWPEPPDRAIGLMATDPGQGSAVELGKRWADALLKRADRSPESWGVEAYRQACATLGRRITWTPGGSGLAVAVDESGRLHVETLRGREILVSGEAHLVR